MRGIKFTIPDLYDSHINKIFNEINLEKYVWKVVEEEVLTNAEKPLFSSEVLNGQDFGKIISYPLYYTIFLNLQAYSPNSSFYSINTYEDFLKSDCEIVLFISDSVFTEVYAKDEKVINSIKHNAEMFGFKKIEFIVDENDNRIEFTAL